MLLELFTLFYRKLQARSLEDDVSALNIGESVGNIDEFTKQCACFPKSDTGIPVSKYLPPNTEHERLVVYLYRNRKTNQLTAFIPSWKKQGIFPDLSFDIDDKLDQIPYEGIPNLFHQSYFPKSSEEVHVTRSPVSTLIPREDGMTTRIVPGVPDHGILSKPISDNQGNLNKVSFVNGPSAALPLSLPRTSDKIIQVSKPNQELNSAQGNLQLSKKETFIGPTLLPNEPLRSQNQPMQGTPVLPDGMHTQYYPMKPIINGKNIPVTFPELSSQLPQKVNLQLGRQYQPTQGPLDKNLNIPSVPSLGFGDLGKYGLPPYVGLLPPSKTHTVLTPSKIDVLSPDRPKETVNVRYDHPIFNDWVNKQILNIEPERPATGNPLNFHSLRFFLIRTLYENGIRLMEDGNFQDSNGNVLKLENLKIRPIFLGDPRDYEKLMITNKCVIPYDIKYLEAILLTLEYPPRILAVIPLGNLWAFTDNIQPRLGCVGNCEHCSTCHTSFRSAGSEEDETSSSLNVRISPDDSNESLETSDAVSEKPEENNETNKYIYTAPNKDLSVNGDPEQNKETKDEENELANSNDVGAESKSGLGNFLNILNPTGLGGVLSNIIPIPHRRKGSTDDDSTAEVNNEKEFFDVELLNKEEGGNLHETDVKSDTKLKENDSKIEEPKIIDSNKKLLMKESSDLKADQNVLILQLKPNDQGVLNGDVIFLDKENGVVEKKPLDDFEVTQETIKSPEDEDYEMLTIRIVGGNPATSSGTPVISRGRSGFTDH